MENVNKESSEKEKVCAENKPLETLLGISFNPLERTELSCKKIPDVLVSILSNECKCGQKVCNCKYEDSINY